MQHTRGNTGDEFQERILECRSALPWREVRGPHAMRDAWLSHTVSPCNIRSSKPGRTERLNGGRIARVHCQSVPRDCLLEIHLYAVSVLEATTQGMLPGRQPLIGGHREPPHGIDRVGRCARRLVAAGQKTLAQLYLCLCLCAGAGVCVRRCG